MSTDPLVAIPRTTPVWRCHEHMSRRARDIHMAVVWSPEAVMSHDMHAGIHGSHATDCARIRGESSAAQQACNHPTCGSLEACARHVQSFHDLPSAVSPRWRLREPVWSSGNRSVVNHDSDCRTAVVQAKVEGHGHLTLHARYDSSTEPCRGSDVQDLYSTLLPIYTEVVQIEMTQNLNLWTIKALYRL